MINKSTIGGSEFYLSQFQIHSKNKTGKWDLRMGRQWKNVPVHARAIGTTWVNQIFKNSRITRRLNLNWIRRSVGQNEDALDLKWPCLLKWVCLEIVPSVNSSCFLCYFMRDWILNFCSRFECTLQHFITTLTFELLVSIEEHFKPTELHFR